jgi:hypothetical protein
MTKKQSKTQGIEVRRANGCAIDTGARCTCSPRYRAMVFDAALGKQIRKTFASAGQFGQ